MLHLVAFAELPRTTELQAPVPPTEELPKTMVPVAPGKFCDESPIAIPKLIAFALFPTAIPEIPDTVESHPIAIPFSPETNVDQPIAID